MQRLGVSHHRPSITNDVSLTHWEIQRLLSGSLKNQVTVCYDFHPTPRLSTPGISWRDILRWPRNIMISENVFHQRGITLLYRTSNLLIQSLLYGKFRILISILYSNLYVLRNLCISFPSFDVYNDVSYLSG